MIPSDHKKYYSRFLEGHKGKLHFAAHSHHFWPDVSREAHLQYWDDCSLFSDEKWSKIFSEIMPQCQDHIARILGLADSRQIAFGPNTHELTTRLLSHFLGRSSLSILTTTNEFHSWRRQLLRLMELPEVKVNMVSGDDFLARRRDFIDSIKIELRKRPDIFFISQVFFDSGLALSDDELLELNEACEENTIMVVDGYHGFAAIPTNLSKLEGKIFYLGGGYKYAQAGEGVGFMVIPKGEWRPAYTGWFAEYAELTRPPGGKVGYSQDWMAFMGATQDPSGLYRFKAVWDLFLKENISINKIHSHILSLQKAFLASLPEDFCKRWNLVPLFDQALTWHGHFLTFNSETSVAAERLEKALREESIQTDRRGTRLRFGFGLYQDLADVAELAARLKKLA